MMPSQPADHPKRRPDYFTMPLGIVATATLLLPVIMFFYDILPDYSVKTKIMSLVVCLLLFFFAYMYKRTLYEGGLKRSVRGAKGINWQQVAFGSLIVSLGFEFLLALDLFKTLEKLLSDWPFLFKLLIRPIQIAALAGPTLSLSILAALDYMDMLEKAGGYERPLHLRSDVDLPDLAIGLLKENLRIPDDAEWKIVEREKLPTGGLRFVLSWEEEVERALPNQKEKVNFTQEKRFEVELDLAGKIVSLKAHKG